MTRKLIQPEAIYDSAEGSLIGDRNVLIEDDKIVAIGTEAEIADTHDLGEVAKVALPGKLLFPGLMNTHVHFAFDASNNARQTYLDETPEQRIARSFANARDMVTSGVTTARDCGSDLEVMEAMLAAQASDAAPLPNLIMTGPPITIPQGHLYYMGGEAETAEQIEDHIDHFHKKGAGSAKVMATGGQMTPGTWPEKPAFELPELAALVQAARKRGMSTVSHCLSTEGTIRSAKAGFDSIEHCAFFERTPENWMERVYKPEVTQEIVKSGASVMMGLAASYNGLNAARETGQGTELELFRLSQEKRMMEIFSTMREAGVPMVCGTDAGTSDSPFDETWKELVLMVGTGMSVPEAIHAATLGAARALRIETIAGDIRRGMRADFIALSENPLERPEAFSDVAFVMVAGKAIALSNRQDSSSE